MTQIALIATGDEIINGDLLNTNGQHMCHALFEQGYDISNHITCPDDDDNIIAAIHFLLAHNDIIIITGGLGPTTDDRTRFALAKALKRELIFDDACWQRMLQRFKQYQFNVPESNKQQAWFPTGATVLKNDHGSAEACQIEEHGKFIFMLPGPPHECLPIFTRDVLPTIQQHFPKSDFAFLKWRLLNVSESALAEQVEAAVKPFACQTGYRASFPHLEVKIKLFNRQQQTALVDALTPIVSAHSLPDANQSACDSLRELLIQQQKNIHIDDQVTRGTLAKHLHHPDAQHSLIFSTEKTTADTYVTIRGFDAYWTEEPNSQDCLIQLHITQGSQQDDITIPIIYRYRRSLDLAVELIAWHLWQVLQAEALKKN